MREYNVYGESAIVPANSAFLYPENISPIEASTIWIQYLTAYFAFVDIGKLQPSQHVLINVAAAVANAVYHATGKRIRELPITPDKLL
jgi:NADPH:quinone reductase-like Zn-dependent oxidoreductase